MMQGEIDPVGSVGKFDKFMKEAEKGDASHLSALSGNEAASVPQLWDGHSRREKRKAAPIFPPSVQYSVAYSIWILHGRGASAMF